MKIVVIDGQGGALGKSLISAIRNAGRNSSGFEIIAVGTNSAATSTMLSAGADRGATGENPAAVACSDADIIAGPVGILSANSMLGEITPLISRAVGASRAKKYLIPVSKCDIVVVGVSDMSYAEYVKLAAEMIVLETGRNAPGRNQ
ncbi:MAG: DUF3842 family protein [Synergistaceae bacterium]|jgi:hypothetical protein|nr:DUF3842 family protein [Synergistaceae bacterium]